MKKDYIKYWQDELVKLGWPDQFNFKFDVNKWGSCQYSSALAFYNLYFKIRKNLSNEDTLKVLKINVTFDKIVPFNKAKSTIMKYIKQKYDNDFWKEEKINEKTNKLKNYDQLFSLYKKLASDLWCTAPLIAEFAFTNLKISSVPISGGTGPVLNMKVQEDNIYVGLCCALLMEYKLVKREASFANFDT